MTVVRLLRLIRTRWWLVAGGLVATALFVALAAGGQTVYSAKATLTVQAPTDTARPRPWMSVDPVADPIPATGVLVALVNGTHPLVRSTSPDATLYGEGLRRATSARLLNTGSQWVSIVRDPVIEIEVVDSDEPRAASALTAEVARVTSELDALQENLAVADPQRLTLVLTPAEPSFAAVPSSRARAMGATLMAGLCLTIALAYWGDRWLRGLRQRHQASVTVRTA